MSDETLCQTIIDAEHLRLLSIGYLISAGVAALFSLMGLIYMFMGVILSVAFKQGAKPQSQSPPPALGWILGIVGLAFFLLLVTAAVLKFRTAQCLKRRQSRTFCMVIAAISCLEIPYGTALGVFTFLVLDRNSIRLLFEPGQAVEKAALRPESAVRTN